MATGKIQYNGWTLLWTNASPTSSFVAQTIQHDLSDFHEVQIICNEVITDFDVYVSFILRIMHDLLQELDTIRDMHKSGVATGLSRWVTVNTDGVVFGDATAKSLNAGSGTSTPSVNGNLLVPVQIYAR